MTDLQLPMDRRSAVTPPRTHSWAAIPVSRRSSPHQNVQMGGCEGKLFRFTEPEGSLSPAKHLQTCLVSGAGVLLTVTHPNPNHSSTPGGERSTES